MFENGTLEHVEMFQLTFFTIAKTNQKMQSNVEHLDLVFPRTL